jgi:hypothetical protein
VVWGEREKMIGGVEKYERKDDRSATKTTTTREGEK